MTRLAIASLLLLAARALAAEAGEREVAEFDAAWRIVHQSHFDTTFGGQDWEALREEYRPRARAADSPEEGRRVIAELLARLGQSHFGVVGADDDLDGAPGAADPGLELREVDGAWVVTRVDSGGPAARAGVRPGWALVAVDGVPVAPIAADEADSFRAWQRVLARLGGEPGSECRLLVDDGAARREIALERRPPPGLRVRYGNLAVFVSRFESASLEHAGRRVGVIRFNYWMPARMAEFDAAVERLRDHDGIVLDLRGNLGGVGATVIGAAGHFLDERVSLGTLRTRGGPLEYRANPRRVDAAGRRVEPFAGPLAILVDGFTGSTSEIFAGGLQALGRARVFGEATMGAVLPATFERLPHGSVLYHAVADFVTPRGESLEGRGVLPDEPVATRRAALLAGEDPVLDAALAWLAAQTAPRP